MSLTKTWQIEMRNTFAYGLLGKAALMVRISFGKTYTRNTLTSHRVQMCSMPTSSLEEVRPIVAIWIENYSLIFPHEALQGLSPYPITSQTGERFDFQLILLDYFENTDTIPDPKFLSPVSSQQAKNYFVQLPGRSTATGSHDVLRR